MKKFTVLLLVAVMLLTMFAACGKTEDKKDDVSTKPSSSVDGNSDPSTEPDEEPTEIEFWMWMDAANSSDATREKIADAVNEIAEREINVRVNFTWPASADYATQMTLAIANNETIDIALMSYPNNLARNYANGSCMDITDYVYEYGTDIVSTLGDMLDAVKIDGKVYGISCYRNYNSDSYIRFRTGDLEAAGVLDKFYSMTTWAEYEEVLEAITNTGLYALGGMSSQGVAGVINVSNLAFDAEKIDSSYLLDCMGDSLWLANVDSSGTVSLITRNEGIIEGYKKMADWMDKGYVWPDAAYSNEPDDAQVAAGVFSGKIDATQFGAEVSYSSRTGVPVSARSIATGMIELVHPRSLGCFVPVSSAEPIAAVKFLNLLYSNADVMNLLTYGIEGENYVVDEDGEAALLEGATTATSGYRQNEWWGGNNFILLPLDGNGTNFRADALDNLKGAYLSPYYNLTVDLSDYSTLVATISAVKTEYHSLLTSGYYTEKYHTEYIEKLEAAGIEEYLSIFQAAVDEYQG